jgi:hypothetical protein
VVEEHGRVGAVADAVEGVGIEFGIDEVVHGAAEREGLGDGGDDHGMPEIGRVGGIGTDGVDGDVVTWFS